jgi:hypothetical protein
MRSHPGKDGNAQTPSRTRLFGRSIETSAASSTVAKTASPRPLKEATRMKTSTCCYWSLAVLLTALANRSAGAEPLSRVEIAKIGKAATALVEIQGRRAYGSAFCIHPSGLFITNDHVAQGDLTIILKPGSKNGGRSRCEEPGERPLSRLMT